MVARATLIALTLSALVSSGCQTDSGSRWPLTAKQQPSVESVPVMAVDAAITPEATADADEALDQEETETRLVAFESEESLELDDEPFLAPDAHRGEGEPIFEETLLDPAPHGLEEDRYSIDLPTVLRLAGAENWGVKLAYERICEAQANLDTAEVMWLPSLNLGIGYTKHDGQIQDTSGRIIDVSRNSLFVGGGAVTANAPTAGGSGGPARLFVDLSLADAIFQPLARRQDVNAAFSSHARVFNDTQLAASLAYYDLVAAQGMLAITVENLTDARQLEEITAAFVAAGKASEAEVKRVQVIVANRRQEIVDAELAVRSSSARLARIIRLDPLDFGMCALLQSVETHVVPVDLIPCACPLDVLISQGRSSRAEVAEEYARVQSRGYIVEQEFWRPWIPNVHVGVSAGGFGGGVGSDLDGLNGRSDVDALLIWQVQNLGLGTAAARRRTESQHRQALLRSHQVQDIIAAEVKLAWSEVDAGHQQIAITQETLATAGEVYDSSIDRIRGLEGLPIEAIQALDAVAQARLNNLTAVIRYNRGQLKLLRAIGQPLE